MSVLTQFLLEDKTAIVTGGEGLLGRLICKTIHELGGLAISADINPQASFVCDITNQADCRFLAQNFPKVDILVNAAVGNQKPVPEFLSRWEEDLSVGLSGAAYVTDALAPALVRSKGVILNIGSDLSLIGPDMTLYPDGLVKPASYSAVKHGMVGLTRYYASALRGKVRVNCLCPGSIDQGQRVPRNLMGRLARLEEMAGPIAFMVSPASSYMSGAIVSVDGGRT